MSRFHAPTEDSIASVSAFATGPSYVTGASTTEHLLVGWENGQYALLGPPVCPYQDRYPSCISTSQCAGAGLARGTGTTIRCVRHCCTHTAR